MANLVRLFLDKDTGKIVASGSAVSSETSGGGAAAANQGYVHIQAVASTLWEVDHNIGNDRVLVQVYRNDGFVILPNEIHVVSPNSIDITFESPIAGRAHIIFFTPP